MRAPVTGRLKVAVAEHPLALLAPDPTLRPDHYSVALARLVGADFPSPWPSSRVHDWVEVKAGFKIRAARHAWKKSGTDVFVSMSEQVAFPLELLNRRRTPHVVLAHNLVTTLKRQLHKRIGWLNWFDQIAVFSHSIADFLTDEIGIDPARVHTLPHPTDHRFYAPQPDVEVDAGLVVAVGREHRDYLTLIEAMRSLPDAKAVIVSNSPWAKNAAAGENSVLPPNVTFASWLSAIELRSLMASAAVMAVPLQPGLLFAGGINGLIEAKAMGRPVVASASPGIARSLDFPSTLTVPPADPQRLADAIRGLLADPVAAEKMGRLARAEVEATNTNDQFAETMAELALGTVR